MLTLGMIASILRKSPVRPRVSGSTEDEFVGQSTGAVTTTGSTLGSVSCAFTFSDHVSFRETKAQTNATTYAIWPSIFYRCVYGRTAVFWQCRKAGIALLSYSMLVFGCVRDT